MERCGRPASNPPTAAQPGPACDTSVAILGAGFAGLCMALKLLETGQSDFMVFEKAGALGGTWRDNTYPGCACDVPSHLYSYSFAQHSGWSRRYASQAEILAYIRDVARRSDLERHMLYDTPIATAEWVESERFWRLTTKDGRHYTARAVVSAVGSLHIPSFPGISGSEQFAGAAFHTARWRHDVDLTGKRVAVIGAGASAVQVVPEIAPHVAKLHVFQRTPQWIMPRRYRPYSALERLAYRYVPGLLRASRAWYFWKAESTALGFVTNPKWMHGGEKRARDFLNRSITDRALRRKLKPKYRLGCKRVVMSDAYYPALSQSHVELVTTRIERMTHDGIVTADRKKRDVDVVVYATGFRPFDPSASIAIRGRDGRRLSDEWRHGPQAYRGVAVSGFPNYFMILGPNSGLGHNSIVFMIECQVRYIRDCLSWLESGKADAVDVRPDVQDAFNSRLEAALHQTVWKSSRKKRGCSSWYVHSSGRNTAIWPGFASSYWLASLRAHQRDFLPAMPREPAVPVQVPIRRAA
ncbi:MAG: flavin-containing monooxygenase [Planctomycetaceae bacterium]